MKILTGIDITHAKRIDSLITRYGDTFKNKVFTENEITYCDSKRSPYMSYAKRFAGKEAFLKALGIGIFSKIHLKDISIINNEYGMPFITLSDSANEFLNNRLSSVYNISISLSDDVDIAVASVTIIYKGN